MIRCNCCNNIVEDNVSVCPSCKKEIDKSKAVKVEKQYNSLALFGLLFSFITPPLFFALSFYLYSPTKFYESQIIEILGMIFLFELPLQITIFLFLLPVVSGTISIISLVTRKKYQKDRTLMGFLGLLFSVVSILFLIGAANQRAESFYNNSLCPRGCNTGTQKIEWNTNDEKTK